MIGRRRNGFFFFCLVLLGLGVLCALGGPSAQGQQAAGFSDAAVEKAIDSAKKNLWAQYNAADGHWPEPAAADNNYGGYSALPIYALLASGESYQDERMKKALDWLSRIDSKGTYTLGLRCQIWLALPKEIGYEMLKKDVERLVGSISQPPPGRAPTGDIAAQGAYGSYTYVSTGKPGPGGDNSNTQYGILGAWAGARGAVEFKKEYWDLVFRHFVLTQNSDGGWSYGGGGNSSGTMTAAGLASMFVAVENLFMDEFVKVGANPDVPTIKKALDWFDKNFAGLPMGGYYLYGVERVGLASGRKYFGKQDWYKIGASYLIRHQEPGGGWGGPVETSFDLLFLVRGRAPVLFNRLEFAGEWNNRPRGLANLTRWISRTFEREVNWQIINLLADVEEWHDAPILLIASSKKPAFTDADLDKLRNYVWQGGMILSVAEGKDQGLGAAFDAGMREHYKKLFPDYELRLIPLDHEIYVDKDMLPVKQQTKLYGLSNGVRLLALHCTDDLPLSWQRNEYKTSEAFKLASNIVFFATDRRSLRYRGTTSWPGEPTAAPTRAVKVARIRHNGNWNPEPLAWERFRRQMGEKYQIKLQLGQPMTLEQLKVEDYRVAAITGTGPLNLSEAEKKALKEYVQGGGTVIMDAAGGGTEKSEPFGDSAAKLCDELFGADLLRRVPTMSGLYRQGGMEIAQVKYRRAARQRSAEKLPRILGLEVNGRLAVLLSREDLTAGLAGYPCYTCIGYDPESAELLMRNMVVYAHRSDVGGQAASAPLAAAKQQPE